MIMVTKDRRKLARRLECGGSCGSAQGNRPVKALLHLGLRDAATTL